ncbi:unnamed protein product [Dracunculus medinensis]|uniref:SHSP domain-containing protein n=1 Tax=Dracunculus medinensis TaxID=318479 RepID=A0A0N4U750_DRAME|nr:unnamed protein product [Dracunculus medinensis]
MLSDTVRNTEQFGGSRKYIRRKSSSCWEIPTKEASKFAKIRNDDKGIEVEINLDSFPHFHPEDIDVCVTGYDLQIFAQKDNPNNPNYPSISLSRQYRLPDDIDLDSVKIVRPDRRASQIKVRADKVQLAD